MKKKLLTRLTSTLKYQLGNEVISKIIIESLIRRKWLLEENRPDNDNDWEHFDEWEALQNWMEDAGVDYVMDNDGGIHLTEMKF